VFSKSSPSFFSKKQTLQNRKLHGVTNLQRGINPTFS
jgi:hypothetical protein